MKHETTTPIPAIVRDVNIKKDGPTNTSTRGPNPDKIISQPKTTVTRSRGFGESGYKVQVVNHDCPECGFEKMVRRIDVSPTQANEVRYWCLNPNCVHFVSDSLSFACHGSSPQRRAQEPAVSRDTNELFR